MNIRFVRKKIKSVFNVKKITKAMQLVSAIKMKKAQQLAIEGQPYRTNLDMIIRKVLINLETKYSLLMSYVEKSGKKNLAIIISSNKGLCGAFNFNLFRYLVKEVDFDNTDFITNGKKAIILINKMSGKIIADFSSNAPEETVSAIFYTALTEFINGHYKEVYLYYNKFVNTLNYEPTKVKLLPVIYETDIKENREINKGEYLIEPAPRMIIDSLLRSFIEEKIRGAIIDSQAAEHSSRMIAMKNATDNAEDVIYNLTLLRNKLRQEKITNELLDMITAKESVEVS